jgi:hypothetical protein
MTGFYERIEERRGEWNVSSQFSPAVQMWRLSMYL